MYSLTFCLALFCLQQLSENGKKNMLMIKNVAKQFYQSSDNLITVVTKAHFGLFTISQ